jgi:hypothetical protein
MTDFFTEINRIMECLAQEPDIAGTALVGGDATYLILSDECEKYVAHDAWLADCDATLMLPEERGTLTARACRLAGVDITFLFGQVSWALEPLTTEARNMAGDVWAIHDPRGLIRNLERGSGRQRITFASNDHIAQAGGISSDFFRLIGLGHALFISDTSTLKDWCEASGLTLEHANARIHEVYGVDVSDLCGVRLIDIFDRIREGDYYRAWQAKRRV